METRESLSADIEYLDACLNAMHERAGDGALTPDQDADFKAGVTLRDEKRAALKAIEERYETLERQAKDPAATVPGATFSAPGAIVRNDPFDLSDLRFDATPGEVRSRGLAAIEKVAGLSDAHRERAEELVRGLDHTVALRIAATGSDDYRSAFGKRLADPLGRNLTPAELAAEARAASLTDNAGGYAVPFTLDPTLILTSDGSSNPFRQIDRVVPNTTDTWN